MKRLAVTHLKRRGYELIVDNFAGGGGASTGIEQALGRSPDVAINHDPEALAMHLANHPATRHYATDVFDIDPMVVCRGRPIGAAWFSPDCTHHSKARGGKPIREAGKKSRSLAWVVVRWASLPLHLRPRVILLENVEEFRQWGPLIDGKPCPARKGKTFRKWVRALERRGYQVEHRELRACDYGAPTIRKRLFVIARCDGKRIVWPEPTHGNPNSPEVLAGMRRPWRTAAEIIDWSIPCPSIFLTPEEARAVGCRRPLKPNTLKRIARGLDRYVLNNPKPFIVYGNHGGDWFRGRSIDDPMATVTASRDAVGIVDPFLTPYYGDKGGAARTADLNEPLPTQPTENRFGVVAPFVASTAHSTSTGRGPAVWSPEEPVRTVTSSNDHCVVAPVMTYAQQGGAVRSPDEPLQTITASTKDQNAVIAPVLTRDFGNSAGAAIDAPAATIMPGGGGKTALVSAFIAQHNTGMVGHTPAKPLSTITARGTQQQVVAAAFVSHQRGSNVVGGDGRHDKPLNTLTAGGTHVAQVMAFLQTYYGQGEGQELSDPVRTVVTKERFGLVTVHGVDYQIVDIGMRMLTPRELYHAQGFPVDYIINPVHQGRPLTKSSQVRMCGNSVCPPLAEALVRANCRDLAKQRRKRPAMRQRELAGV